MLVDAIVLAGGRSSRLGATQKAGLVFQHQTLLESTLAAVAFSRSTVVVGDVQAESLPPTVRVTREEPHFSGPAAGIAAGHALLTSTHSLSDYTFVLACDMPLIGDAVAVLFAALRTEADTPPDGVIAVDEQQRLQPLAAAYKTTRLHEMVESARKSGKLDSMSVFRLISGLSLKPVPVPAGTTDDVDTWQDAHRFGIERHD